MSILTERIMSKTQSIIDEMRNKIEDYESNMSTWLDESNSFADLYRIKPPNKKKNTYSNPRLPEMHRAVEALTTTTVRMMTTHDPYFETRLMDFDVPDENVYLVQKTLEAQLKISNYKLQLTKGMRSLITFGTVFVEEPFQMKQINPFGRKMPVTGFLPRSIIQMGFDRSALDIMNGSWKYTNDLISKGKLLELSKNDAMAESSWVEKAVNNAIEDKDDQVNQFLRSRITRNGYNVTINEYTMPYELVTYYGKLDSMNDNVEYVCGLVNRKHLVRFIANADQSGMGNFRVAKWIDFEADPLGYGLGRLLGRTHRSMDANRQKTQDLLSFGAYNIWLKSNMAGINASDMVLRPNKIIGADDMNGLKQLVTDTSAAVNALKLEEMQKQDFRNASGATDTLQAAVTEATASEVAITQNEAMRRLSVYVENVAEPMVREHIEKCHNNNRMNLAEPFIIGTDYGPKTVYPKDLNIDVDIAIKIVTDKDFRPKRLEQLVKMIELASSIRQENPDKYRISTLPLYREIARGLDVNPDSIIRPMEEAAQLHALNIMTDRGAFPGMPEMPEMPEMPAAEQSATPSQGVVMTPVGPVSGSANQEPVNG